MQSGETAGEWDAAFSALGSVHRRQLLVSLLEHNPQEDTVKVPEILHDGDGELETLQLEFVHKHLPLLEDLGYIEWDREAHQVVKGPAFDEIRPLLVLIEEHADELPDGWM